MRLISILLSLIFALQANFHCQAAEYKLKAYDQISMVTEVNGKPKELLNKVPVLPNGNITIPGKGEIRVVELTVEDLERKFPNSKFTIYHQNKNVSVIGRVNTPGSYSTKNISTVYDAIASAGGFTNVANKSKVKIIRQHKDGSREEFIVDFPKEVFEAIGEQGIGEDKYLINEGDIIWVPASKRKQTLHFIANLFNSAVQVSTIGLISGSINAALD